MPEHLLLVEDDAKLATLLSELLQGHGWTVTHCDSGEAALEQFPNVAADLVILDIMLPGIDGIEVCQRLRQQGDTRILMLTALGSDADQILGLEIGADDYLVKTAPTRLLVARIKALLRRNTGQVEAEQSESILELGWCRVDLCQQRVWLESSEWQEAFLSGAEFEVLERLAVRAGNVVTREELFKEIFHRPYDSMDRTLDRRVVRLRRSLLDPDSKFIRTVRGVGYMAVQEQQQKGRAPC